MSIVQQLPRNSQFRDLGIKNKRTGQEILVDDTSWCKIWKIGEGKYIFEITIYGSSGLLTLKAEETPGTRTIQVESFRPNPLFKDNLQIYMGKEIVARIDESVVRTTLELPKPTIPAPHIEGKTVAAVITTYNGLGWTAKSVESIRNLKTSHKISIIVSDNCSTDGTREWAEKEGIIFSSLFGRRPVAAGINLGLKEAMKLDPDYILVMNNDIQMPPNYLDVLVDQYESKREMGCLFITGYVKEMSYSKPEIVRLKNFGLTEDMLDFIDTGDFSCFLITPETVKRAGFFDENYVPRYGEDNDYLHKIYAAGGKGFRTGKTSFYHDWGTIFKIQPFEKESHLPTFRQNMAYYRDKWGDFPRGAERHPVIKDLTQKYPCQGGALTAKELSLWDRDQVVLVQMGRTGDVIATLPIAEEIHDAGEKVVWLVNQRYLPLLRTMNYIDEVVTFPNATNDYDSFFGKRFNEARAFAEKEKFRRTVIAQITPLHTKEFYASPYVHNKFHYIVCLGRMPKTLKPHMPIVPFPLERQKEHAVGLILKSHSLPIHWNVEELDRILQKVTDKLEVEYLNLSLEAYGGRTPVREVGCNISLHQLSGAIDSLDLLLTVDTGAYYPGLVTGTPIIHMIPKPNFTDVPEAPKKYPAEEQGFSEFCEIIDYWYNGNFADLADIIMQRLQEGRDLREIKKEYAGTNRKWMNL